LTTYLPLKGKVTRDFFASIYFIDWRKSLQQWRVAWKRKQTMLKQRESVYPINTRNYAVRKVRWKKRS
jgi:hypothetical protein